MRALALLASYHANKSREMIRYKEKAQGVFSIQLLKPVAAREMVDSIRMLDGWQSAQVRSEEDGRYNSDTNISYRAASVLESPAAATIHHRLSLAIERRVKPLVRHIWGVKLTEHEEPQIVRYQRGGLYRAHSDAEQDLTHRYFTIVCYLNDDFQAGGTGFPSLNFVAVPECGKAIIFPAKYTHSAEPVLQGEKYVMVSWLVGALPMRWI